MSYLALLFRQLNDPNYQPPKNAELSWIELDNNQKLLGDAIALLNNATPSGVSVYDAGTEYTEGDIVSYDENLWLMINPIPQTGITPGTDGATWELTSTGALSHAQNTDEYLDFGGTHQVSAADLYSLLNSGDPKSLHINGSNAMLANLDVGGFALLHVSVISDITGVPSIAPTGRELYDSSGNTILQYSTIADGIALINAASFTTFIKSIASATRTVTIQDADGTLAFISDINAAIVGIYKDQGNFTPSGSYPTSADTLLGDDPQQGYTWTISGLGTGITAMMGSITVEDGDVVRALVNSPGQTDTSWAAIERNLGYIPFAADGRILATGAFDLDSNDLDHVNDVFLQGRIKNGPANFIDMNNGFEAHAENGTISMDVSAVITNGYLYLEVDDSSGSGTTAAIYIDPAKGIGFNTGGNVVYLRTDNATSNWVYQVPNQSGTLIVDAELALKEDLANKATDFTTVNNTKYPSTEAVVNLRQMVLSKAVNVVANTGVTTEIVMYAFKINANTILPADFIDFKCIASQVGSAGSKTTKAYFNTTAQTPGSVYSGGTSKQIAIYTVATTPTPQYNFARSITVTDNTHQYVAAATLSNLNDYSAIGAVPSNIGFDPTVDQWFVITTQCANAADSISTYGCKLELIR